MIENTILFKQPPPKIGGMLPDAKVCQVVHTVLTLLLSSCIMHLNAILKELTTKSILSTWGQRSLACAWPVAGYIHHVIHWCVQFSFVLGSVSHFLPLPLPLGFVGFSPLMFSVWRVLVPFLWCGGPWLGCAVVPVMGALFQSRGWLPIVEAPGYSRHPTSISTMQLLIKLWIRGEAEQR